MTARSETQRQLIQSSTLGAGVGLVLALFVMVNYLSLRHYKRLDWTSSQLYSLSERSQSLVASIDREVDMVIFLNPASELYDAVDELLSRYAAANPALITKREVDPAKNLLQARRLVEKYSIERDNVVVIATEDDRRVISEIDLAEYDYSGAQFGQPPKLTGFKGEQLITSALLALMEAQKPKVLFTTGHGEAQLDPGTQRSLSRARDLLGEDNYEIDFWSSLGQNEVPEDTDLLVIAGPTTNFLPPELELLDDYLAAGGRLLMMLDPVFNEGTDALTDLGLTAWLEGYGITLREDIIIDPTSELPFFGPETIFTDAFGLHPIVEDLEQTRTRVLLPLARSVSPATSPPEDYEVTSLIRTSGAGWGETNLTDLENVAPDDQDVQGPVSLGVAVAFEVEDDVSASPEDGGANDLTSAAPPSDDTAIDAAATDDAETSLEPDQARMVVLGDLDFATDSQLTNGANGVLLLNAFNWLVKREQLIDIQARTPEQTTLSLTQAELSQVYLLVLVVLPGLAVTFGVWIHMRRRR